MHTILLASGNPGKLREMQALLDNEGWRLVLPINLGIQLEVLEDGTTYAENAAKKALAFAKASGLLTLADDSGLEVEALNGAPGLHSARYHPRPGANDADRRAHLIAQLRTYPRPWLARFHCTIALAVPGKNPVLSEGYCHGQIIPEERGSNGFGYDPIFFISTQGKTMAELDLEEKNRISHRAEAIRAAIPLIHQLFSQDFRSSGSLA